MFTKLRWIFGALLIVLAALPLWAGYSSLEATTIAVSGNELTVAVHNPGTATELARVQVEVSLGDGRTESLTSSNLSVSGEATMTITLSASGPIAGIIDAPEPIIPY